MVPKFKFVVHFIRAIVLLILFTFKSNAQNETFLFNHLWVENGLSQSTIFSIYKDQKGFMWFGTQRGLNRYDGFEFFHYMHNPSDSNSLSSNFIRTIIGDSKDNLIIQTKESVDYFDRYKKKFFHIPINNYFYSIVKDSKGSIWTCSTDGLFVFNESELKFDTIKNIAPFNNLNDIAISSSDEIWLAGNNNKIVRYNQKSNNFKEYYIESDAPQQIRIESDPQGRIWLCLSNGLLYLFDEQKDQFININSRTSDVLVSNFGVGLNNTMVICTNGNGIVVVNTETYQTNHYNHQPDNPKSLTSNTYYSIFADQKLQILWLGSYMGGIDYHNNYDKGLNFIYHLPYKKNSILNNNIRSLYYDDKLNQIWVGTRQGISVMDTLQNIVKTFDQNLLRIHGISNPIITKISEDKNGFLWICSYKGGVVLYDLKDKKLKKVSEIYSNVELYSKLGVFDVLMDSKKNIWVASESGTYLFPENKKGFVFESSFSKVLLEDRTGRIFIGTTFFGLFMVNNSLQIEKVTLDSNSASKERINNFFEDPQGHIWIGTGGNGIFKYNPYNNSIKEYSKKNGLPDNYISAMVMDPDNNIWVSTYSSIAKFVSKNEWFKKVNLEKGVKGKEFNPNSIALSPNGTIYLGSINGLLKLDINRYKENPYLPKVVFTNILINNHSTAIGDINSPLENNIMFTDNISLKHHQNTLTLNFTAPDFYMGDKVQFKYKIGENTKWIDLGNNRSINLVDLNPGEYALEVKAANSDGYSTLNGSSLIITIVPPPWKTVYAYIFYALLLTGVLFIYRRFIKSKINLKYELLLQKTEKNKQDEINQARIRLFTDVSHEIGTSLTLMNIPLETLNRIEDDNLKKGQLDIIAKNVARLRLLVKKIIGLRKIETGNMTLKAEKDDIVNFTKAICSNYEPMARNKNITFLYDFPLEEITTWFDKEIMEFILFNLLSNAFKFEPDNGKVWVSVSKKLSSIQGENRKSIIISVCNEGSFIPQEKSENIFKRFYKGGDSNLGFGIGLNLIQSYTVVQKGEIRLESSKEKGVLFEVCIPYGETYLNKDEKRQENTSYEFKSSILLDLEENTEYTELKSSDGEKIKILIVEDNIELKNILRNQLKKNFEILEAQDGNEGFMKAKNFTPDLIITDYIMPEKNGLDLCIDLRKDIDTGHIPIIMLSAKGDIEDQISGIEAGADAYITKPFSISYLNSVIFNLIELRKKLKNKYYLGSGINSENINITSIDENFLEKAYTILENNIDNLQFGIPEFIDQLGVSKYMLYSKIKDLTGQTPNDFIISYKLKKAAQILLEKKIKDTEIYYKLGFNDVSYFRKCFKKQFGLTPSQYLKSDKFSNNN